MKIHYKMKLKPMNHRIVNRFNDEFQAIPVFLNNINVLHNQCRDISLDILNLLDILFYHKSIPITRIEIMMIEINKLFNEMAEIDSEVSILYFLHIKELLQYYQEVLEDEEDYELCLNIKNILDRW